MRYFDLSDDVHLPGRWRLGTPNAPDEGKIVAWTFVRGMPVQFRQPPRIPISQPGLPLDFTMADVRSVPVVHSQLAALLAELCPSDVQVIPVEVDGWPDRYRILNVLRVVECIDDARCTEVEYWLPQDGRPEKTGTYRGIIGLKVDPTRVGGAQIFRPLGWQIALIVSEDIKDALERLGATGMVFKEV